MSSVAGYSTRQGAEPFLVLSENRLAWHAVEALRCGEGGLQLAFIHGPSGCGKSHLVRQFVRAVLRDHPETRMAQLTASEFAAELAEYADAGLMGPFQERYRTLQILICEDLGALCGRFETQRQFCQALDEVLSLGGCVLLTSQRPAGTLADFVPQLVNRCHAAATAGVQMPGRQSRQRLIEHFSQTRQIPIDASAAALLAAEMPVSPRELLSALTRLDRFARLQNAPLDVPLVQQFLTGEVRPQRATVPEIARSVARLWGVRVGDLRGPSRRRGLVTPRQLAMYLARELAQTSLSGVAEFFGNRHHSSVSYACSRMEQLLQNDAALRRQAARITQELGGPQRPGCG